MKLKLSFPLVACLLSVAYLLYVITSKDTVLAADAVGGDPGGKILPLIMAMFMCLGFGWVAWRERISSIQNDALTRKYFSITIISTVLYVFSLRYIGFIICTAMLLYILEHLYTTLEQTNYRQFLYGIVATTLSTSVVYVLMRSLTRLIFKLTRVGCIPIIFANGSIQAVISLLFVFAFTLIVKATICKMINNRGYYVVSKSLLITFTCVLVIYVVFKQFFNVNLAVGILNF